MDRWQRDLMKTYNSLGIVLASSLANSKQNIYGVTIQYDRGLATDWNKQVPPATSTLPGVSYTDTNS